MTAVSRGVFPGDEVERRLREMLVLLDPDIGKTLMEMLAIIEDGSPEAAMVSVFKHGAGSAEIRTGNEAARSLIFP